MEPFVWKEAKRDGEPPLFVLQAWTERDPNVTVGFTSRHGGVSGSPYGTFNCGYHVLDEAASVTVNRQRLAAAIGVPFAANTYAEQVHGINVVVVGTGEQGAGRDSRESAIQNADGLLTAEVGVSLNLMYADCVPLYLYDPVRRVVGLAHAGWKGTVGNIARAAVRRMAETFGSKPEELLSAIGPSIGVCCYEVDETVADKVRPVLKEIGATPAEGALVLQSGRAPGKYMLNLQTFNRLLLTEAGILSSHIELSHLCTSCNTERFFSHRAEGGRTGRMVAWIALQPDGRNIQGDAKS